jgi:Mismatch repair ATPase (MutS family)
MVSLFQPDQTLSFEEVSQLPEPAFFRDLNLDQYAKKISEFYGEPELIPYFNVVCGTYEGVKYRQEITKDLLTPAIRSAITAFIGKIGEAVNCRQCAEQVTSNLQKCKWYVDCVTSYYQAMEDLCIEFNTTPPKSRAFYALHQELFHTLNSAGVKRLRETAGALNASFEKLRFHLTLNKEKATFDLAYSFEDYCAPIRTSLAKTMQYEDYVPFREPPFPAMEVSPLEAFILKQLEKENRQLFLQLEAFGARGPKVIEQDVLDIIRELRFYISNIDYMDRIKNWGLPLTMPLVVKDKELYMDDCYDIVLAINHMSSDSEVVLNDIMKANFEKAIIVTGPNQGGKTTLARAFGQCFYFGMMGLMVPAGVCKLPYCSGIHTHFANEEGSEGLEGRLHNEIVRVREMLDNLDNRSIVIMNELFTSAPTADALTMSRDLLKRLLSRNAICFYVTHTFEIAFDSDDYVSLVATVVEDGSYRRTYRIVRKRADGAAYANSIVSKYKLDYSHINYRLSKR